MKNRTVPLFILLSVSAPAAHAQVHVQIDIGLPVAPPLVVIQPGIQVVEGFREEVFFRGGWYWCRRPDGWYRARSPQRRFEWVEVRRVPGVLVRMPEGRYRNWHHEGRFDEHRRAEPPRRDERRERPGEGHGRGERDRRRGEEGHGRHER